MTDNEIIKALECCANEHEDCENCPVYEFCKDNSHEMVKETLDLINRQKAEIEMLKAELEDKQFRCDSCDRIGLTRSEHRACVNQAKAEAIKEFWNQRPPMLNPELDGKEQYNKGWNDCISFFAEEYKAFLNGDKRECEEDSGENSDK